jgi:DNA-binding LacI/PurR family transcriptional regulator
VGPHLDRASRQRIETVVILSHAEARLHRSQRVDLLLDGLQQEMPGVNVHLAYIPQRGGIEFVRDSLAGIRQMGELVGVLAASCSREVYRLLADEQVPTVVFGSLYGDQQELLPSIDGDEHQAGRLMTQLLIERGHRRIVLLSDSEGRPGDSRFFDGVSEILTEAQLPHNALVVRFPGPDPEVVGQQVLEALSWADRPTAFAVRIPQWAATVARIAAERGLSVPGDLEIVYKTFVADDQPLPFPHVRPTLSYGEIASEIGRMLQSARQGRPMNRGPFVVPFQLCLPSAPRALEDPA